MRNHGGYVTFTLKIQRLINLKLRLSSGLMSKLIGVAIKAILTVIIRLALAAILSTGTDSRASQHPACAGRCSIDGTQQPATHLISNISAKKEVEH